MGARVLFGAWAGELQDIFERGCLVLRNDRKGAEVEKLRRNDTRPPRLKLTGTGLIEDTLIVAADLYRE